MSDEWIAVWDSLDDPRRSQILATLIEHAAKRAVVDATCTRATSPTSPKSRSTTVLSTARTHAWTICFTGGSGCPAQSGSDWNYHCVYRGTATFADRALTRNEAVQLKKNYVHEYDEKSYDAEAVLREVRAELTDRS